MTLRVLHAYTAPQFLPYIEPLLNALCERGDELHVLTAAGIENERLLRRGIHVHEVSMSRKVAPARDLVSFVKILRVIAAVQPAIVHAHNPKAGLLSMLASQMLGVPMRIFHMHGSPSLTARGMLQPVLLAAERRTASAATHVLCVSSSLRRALEGRGVLQKRQANVLGSGSAAGIALEEYERTWLRDAGERFVREHDLVGRPLVGYIGRYIDEKGLVELAEAWRELSRAYADATLVLAGRKDGQLSRGHELLRTLPRVRDLGFLEDVRPLLGALDVLVLPTYREGLANVLLEAAAAAVPIVATDAVGVVDLVEDGRTGLIVPCRNALHLAAALARIFDDPALGKELGENARRRIAHDFVRSDVVGEFLRLYQSQKP